MILNCFILGDTNLFKIVLGEKITVKNKTIPFDEFNIELLKKFIWEKRVDIISNFKMDLWKVEIEETDENIEKLQNIETDIKEEFGGVKLLETSFASKIYSNSPPKKRIHIIVQLPATTGQERINIQSRNLDYLPRQDGRGGTSLPSDSITGYTIEGVSLTDPDTSMRSDIIPSLIKDLMQKKTILVQSPPYSGKTSLAQLLENCLVQSQEFSDYRVIRISFLWASAVKMECNWETFGMVWEKIIGVSWIEWIGQCKSIPSILIMDEVQMIYKDERGSTNDTKTAFGFWNAIKANLQESSNVYIIMFGAYGYSINSAGLSIPITIPPENSKSLLDIKFTDDELKNYVKIFCNRHFVLLDNNILNDIISKFNKYIQKATAGHVGLVRHILHNTKNAMEWRIRKNVLTWKNIFMYLNSNSFNLTIDKCCTSPKVKNFSNDELNICENIYLNGKTIFRPFNTSTQKLVKSGVLVVIDGKLYFSAPLVMRSFFQQNYRSHNNSEITPLSLYHFIVKIFTVMCNEQSGKFLRETLIEIDKSLLKQIWQKEFYRVGTQVLGKNYFLSYDLGAVFECDRCIDFYVDELEWAIEFLRDDKDMTEYSKRFEPAEEYKEIIRYAKSIAIIDVCNESKKIQKLQEDFIYVSCSENYDAFKIECLGKKSLIINIRD
ncbi:hypothetical protein Glove_460g69 [Diversispora epigaea]|uniref:Crinkler effector protein N-terminal domain-containing protein n=1 Tax=Diversispora epigaea TaxID=1348612 RepID=A0A397GX08_9GLOM|nr:hypothetical protein Glove_460g69 [Diversispora epigaea]